MEQRTNYGNAGGTIGHELHGFDDRGRQFDAQGNLKDWWTKDDAKNFTDRAQCIVDQYAQYPVVDDIKINSKLTRTGHDRGSRKPGSRARQNHAARARAYPLRRNRHAVDRRRRHVPLFPEGGGEVSFNAENEIRLRARP